MSNKYRHTTIILLALSFLLLIGEIIVVAKFFTKEEFKEITYNQESSQNIDYSLSNSKDTNDFTLIKKISEPSNNFNNEISRSNISTSSRSLITRQNLEKENTKNNEGNIKKSTINLNSQTTEKPKIENPENIATNSTNQTTIGNNDNYTVKLESPKEQKTAQNNNNSSNVTNNKSSNSEKKQINYTKKQSAKEINNNSTATLPQDAIGNITIPKTGVNLPIMKNVTLHNMDTATCFLYSTGALNKEGTTIIIGHNYQNGKLFSNNNKLKKGDKIYITTQDGTKKEYTVYDKFITSDDDISYLKRNKSNSPQIALSSCTNDEKNRIIVLAK